MNISYNELNKNQIEALEPLWNELRSHHHELSTHFPQRYIEVTFQKRKEELLKKSENGSLKIYMAKDEDIDKLIGYCISSISNLEGEIDSIYLEKEYRSSGIGDELMNRALNWMDENGVKTKKIVVAVGNEGSLSFYERYNFFPRHLILEQR